MQLLEEGKKFLENQQFEKAVETLTLFLKEYPNHADGFYYRGVSYRKLNLFTESIQDFNSLLVKLPDEPSLLCERAISYFKNQQLDKAMNDLNKAVELDSKNPFRYTSRAFIRAYVDIDGAIADYQKAIELDPNDEIAYNNLGLLQEQRGNFKEAQKNFNESNKIIGYQPQKSEHPQQLESESTPDEKIYQNTWEVIKDVVTSKKVRAEYFRFLGNFFKIG